MLGRIELPFSRLTSKISPSSPVDVLSPGRMRVAANSIIYNPGYNAGIARCTQLITLHDLIHLSGNDTSSRLKRRYYDHVVRPAVDRAGAVMTVSATSAEAITKWLGDPHIEVVNVGNGCSDVFLQPAREEVRQKNSFLYVGNLKSHKNVPTLIGALLLRPTAKLTAVIGDTERAKQIFLEAGVMNRVKLLSNVSDPELASIYRRSTALLMPSSLEGFGLPAVEALATQTPVCYWQGCSSIAEIVGERGLALTSANDAEEWSQSLDILNDFGPILGNVEDVRTRFSWASVAGRVGGFLSDYVNS
ncbi:glycosyltransferase [Arthrobacter sp. TMS1-12-1]